jgi:diphosphomevalonate decarboxylase
MPKTTIRAGSNIAFIKYWGVEDATINLPQTSSISMTLADAYTTTTVEWQSSAQATRQDDKITIDGRTLHGEAGARVVRHLDRIRALAGTNLRVRVASRNNFPMASGIASSASGFAALTVAACQALGLGLDATQLSALARLGSGSACRSLFGGFVLWDRGYDHETSVARMLFLPEHWDLYDLVAIVSHSEKKVSSEGGHRLAATSPLNRARVEHVKSLLPIVQEAIAHCDLEQLGDAIEWDALAMHAVMQTGSPSLLYWQPGTLEVIQAVRRWRDEEGLAAYFTIDAGPNVHVLCAAEDAPTVQAHLAALPSVVDVLVSRPGPAPYAVTDHLF